MKKMGKHLLLVAMCGGILLGTAVSHRNNQNIAFAAVETTAVAETTAAAETTADAAQEALPVIYVQGTIDTCYADTASHTIKLSGTTAGDTTGTDGMVYAFQLMPYESGIGTRTDYAAKTGIGGYSFEIPYASSSSDYLYSRFALAVYDGTQFREIGTQHYITNPEASATNLKAYNKPLTKKGLNVELTMLDDAFGLGVKYASVNIAFSHIKGVDYPFEFEGKTYYFNKGIIADYDKMISAFSAKDINVTAILLNDWIDSARELIPEETQKSTKAQYYMFNTRSKEGFDETRAIAAFLAQHFDGSNPNYGKVSNWVIGNEINNQEWNYVGEKTLDAYVKQCQEAFRVFYTAIRSRNANDRVYFSLDYYWYMHNDDKLTYRGKDFLDAYQALAAKEGAIDWNLAWHPYPDPLTEPEFWDDEASGIVNQTDTSPVLNFANLHVLTDYLNRSQFLNSKGEVRSVILTEQGFTSKSPTRGDVSTIQAAAFAYSYYLVDANPDIDAYILTRQVDAPLAVNLGLSNGLWGCDMNYPNEMRPLGRKKIWEVFLKIDKPAQTLEVTQFAKSIIGINKWSDVIPNFKYKNKES